MKKKIKSELNTLIEVYLKSNRFFSKTDKFSLEKYDILDDENKIKFIKNYINYINDKKLYNYVIIQENILRNHYERFLYVDDTYVIILNDSNLFKIIKNDINSFNNLTIMFLNNKGNLCEK
jgi:hypothetical protein